MTSKSRQDRVGKILDSLKSAAIGDYSKILDFASQNDELGLIADAVNTLLQKTAEKFLSRPSSSDLMEDARRYRHILDNIEESYFEVDLKGNLFFFNDTVIRDLGYSPEELHGINFHKLVDETNAKKVYEAFHQVFLTGQSIKGFDWEILKENKEKIDVESSVALLRNETGRPVGFRGVVRNISQRIQTQKDLRQSEEKYRTILDIMNEGYLEHGLSGRITFVNDAACRLMGYQREQLIGMHYHEYLTPTVARKMENVFRGVYKSGKPERLVDYDLLRRDGSIITYEMNVALRYDPSGKPCGFRILIRDVSLRKKAEEERRLSEEKYRNILESMDETYLETDLKGNFIFFNDSLCRVFGYSREELQNINYRVVNPLGPHQHIFEDFNEIYRTGKTKILIDHAVKVKDGSIRIMEMSMTLLRSPAGEPIGFAGIGRDVTEKIKTQRKIEESERHLRLITNNIRDIIWTMDFDLRWTYLSPSVLRITGFTPEEVMKIPLKTMLPPDTYAMIKRTLSEELSKETRGPVPGEQRKTTFELPIMHKNGAPLWVEISADFTRDENGQPMEIIGVTRDISERKKAEEALRESEKRYRMIVENMNDSISIVDLNFNYIYQSPSEIRVTGYTPEEIMSIPARNQMTAESYALAEETLARELAREFRGESLGPHRALRMELEVYHKKGGTIWQEMNAIFQRDDTGKPIGIIITSRDITTRRKAEVALAENEKRYRMIVDNMHDTIWMMDFNLKFKYASPSLQRFTGYTLEEMNQIPLNQLTTPESFAQIEKLVSEDFEIVRGRLTARNPNASRVMELEAINKEGGHFWHLLTVSLYLDGEGNPVGILGVSRDITERKKAELALEESEKLYRMIAENVHGSIALLDLNFEYLYLSPSERRITGYTPEELMRIPLKDQMTPESYELVEKIFAEEWEREFSATPVDPDRSRTMELEVYHKNGSSVWEEVTTTFNRDENGKPVGLMVTTRDITERRKAQKDLKKSEQRYRMIIENMHEVIWTTDLNFQYSYVSPSCLWVTGYTPEEIAAMPLDQLLTPDSFTLAQNALAEEITREFSGEPIDQYRARTIEQELHHKNGGRVWLDVTATFTRDESGQAVGMLMAGKDITARKKAEDEKDKLKAQLIQAQKMETVGRLAGGVAHDFNNMLSVILGYVDLAKLRLARQHPVLKDIAEIEKAAIRSRDITTQLLAFSRKQIIEPKIIDLNELVSHTQKALIRLIGEDVELKVIQEEHLWAILFDPSQIEQILINLAVNARDAMQGGGKLTIETVNAVLDDSYCENNVGFTPGQYVRLSFSDNGAGMDKETLKHIFEPFFTTKEVGKGTGLGLATVYGIVKQNNGFINVYSEPDQGTAFSIYLPRTTGEKEVPEDSGVEPEIAGQGNILLVEDDAMVLQITRGMLESIGYTVMATDSPLEAISLFQNPDASFDLIITDVVMPRMSGKELRNKLLEIRRDIPVLFMSGYTADVIANHGVLEEGVLFIQKPFSIKALASKVAEAMAAK